MSASTTSFSNRVANLPLPTLEADAPMRIAVFNYGLPVHGQKRGGVDRVAHDLADGLARRGHSVTVFCHDARPAGAAYAVAPLPWRRFVSTRWGRAITMGYLGHVLAALPDYRTFDVVLAHGDSLLLPVRGRPVVRVMHGTGLEEARSAESPVRAVLQLGVYVLELLSTLVNRHTVAVSRSTRRFNPWVTHVVPNGVNLQVFRPPDGPRADAPTILFVGTVEGRKRGRQLLQWFARDVQPRVPAAQLWMVAAAGPAQVGVRYFPAPSDAELVRLYQQAWVYASPSTYEGFGLPYLEAMASGTPVVATPNPGSREVLGDGRFGCLAGDDSFADTVCRLLSDSDERVRWRALGLERAHACSLDRSVAEYELLLRSVVS